MSTLAERYQAVADHYREAQPHRNRQKAAWDTVYNAYEEFAEDAGNKLLQSNHSNRLRQQRDLEQALSDYERFMT